ncbi:Zinc finger protein 3-like protein [Frankliniella fusca]|uniref:Zinc finger protein 3-like protein n=1 Tax=Frankliniella fusca TaxID=407009 RepID=A0AAE1H6K2_9NEOP|nr:Zinc finger protein 3-like protein [Frankliniella fusca]
MMLFGVWDFRVNGVVTIKLEPADSDEYRLTLEDSNSSESEPESRTRSSVRDCFVRLENISLRGCSGGRAPRPRRERSPSPDDPRRDGGRGRSRARSRSVAPTRPASRAASRPRHGSRDPRSASCPRRPSLSTAPLGSGGMPRIVLGRSKSASAQRLLKCALCFKSFHMPASLNKHVQAHQRSTPDRCLLCGAHVGGLPEAVDHFLSHPAAPLGFGEAATVECRVCGRAFPRRRLYRLADHVLRHTGEQPFHCATCQRPFRTAASLVGHAERVHGARDAGFKRSAALVRSQTPVFRCPVCAVRLASARGLDRHQREVHGGSRGSGAPCFYCPLVLHSPEDVVRHLREAHAAERPHACKRCPKRFRSKWDLDRHSLGHKFSCSMCPARFSNAKECLDHVSLVHLKTASVSSSALQSSLSVYICSVLRYYASPLSAIFARTPDYTHYHIIMQCDAYEPELVDLCSPRDAGTGTVWPARAIQTPIEEVFVAGTPPRADRGGSPVRIPSSAASLLSSPTKTLQYLSELDPSNFPCELGVVQLTSSQLDAPFPVFQVAEAEDLLSALEPGPDPAPAPSQSQDEITVDPLHLSQTPSAMPCSLDDDTDHELFDLTDYLFSDSEVVSRKCPRCGALLSSNQDLREHNEQVHYGHNHVCGACGETFGSSGSRAAHEKEMHGKTAVTENDADHHVEDVGIGDQRESNSPEETEKPAVPVKEYSCELCGREFRREKALEAHYNRHQDGYGYDAVRRRSEPPKPNRFSLAKTPEKASGYSRVDVDDRTSNPLRSVAKVDNNSHGEVVDRKPNLLQLKATVGESISSSSVDREVRVTTRSKSVSGIEASLALVPVPPGEVVLDHPVNPVSLRRSRRLSHLPPETGRLRNPFSCVVKLEVGKLKVPETRDDEVSCEECGKKYRVRGWLMKHMEKHKRRRAGRSSKFVHPLVFPACGPVDPLDPLATLDTQDPLDPKVGRAALRQTSSVLRAEQSVPGLKLEPLGLEDVEENVDDPV